MQRNIQTAALDFQNVRVRRSPLEIGIAAGIGDRSTEIIACHNVVREVCPFCLFFLCCYCAFFSSRCGFFCRGSRLFCSGSARLRCFAAITEYKVTVNFRSRCNCTLCSCCRTTVNGIQSGNCQCKAAIVIQCRLCAGIRICVIVIRTVGICRTTDQGAVQNIFCSILIRVCCSMMDMLRIRIAKTDQIAAVCRIISQQIVHLPLCIFIVFVLSAGILCISQSIHLPCTVVTGCTPAAADRIIRLILVAHQLIHIEHQLAAVCTVLLRIHGIQQSRVTAPHLIPGINPVIVDAAVIYAVRRCVLCLVRIRKFSVVVGNRTPQITPRYLIFNIATGIVAADSLIGCLRILFCKLFQCICILQASICIICVFIPKCQRSCCQSCCHMTGRIYRRIGCICPVCRSVLCLYFRCSPDVVILVIAYHIAERNDITAVIQISHFHKVVAHFFQNVQKMIFASGFFIGIRIFKIRPSQISTGISHCIREFQMISCIMITAGHIYGIQAAVCSFDCCHGTG